MSAVQGLGEWGVTALKGGGLPWGPVGKTLHFHCRGRGSIPGQGTGFHVPKVRVFMQLKIQRAVMKIRDPAYCT